MNILSLFDGVSCARLALEKNNVKIDKYFASEIDKYAIQVTKANRPDTIELGDVKSITKENVNEPIDLLIGGSPCFTAGHLVTTIDGQVLIEDIKVGDYVLTHNGRFRKVLRVGGCYNKTRIIKGYGFLPIETTDEHPFLCQLRENIWNGNGYTRKLGNKSWYEAKDLNPFKHYVSTTKIKEEYINDFNTDFWKLVGRFIGDGWITDRYRYGKKKINYGVKICCGKHEVETLVNMVEKVFGKHYTLMEERTAYKIHITQKWFADFVSIVGRGAQNKQIPTKWLSLSPEKATALLDGYLSADGCWKKNMKERGYTTASKKLAVSLTMLANRLNIDLSSFVYKNQTTKVIEGRLIRQSEKSYQGTYRISSNRKQCFNDEEFIWKPVKQNFVTHEVKRVYNLEVEEDNSYVVNGICVHNCQDLSVAKKDRQGLEGNRSSLFYEYLRIRDEIKPKYFILENVASMRNADRDTISKALGGIEPCLINAALVSAQQRKRYFWVGKLQEDGTYKQINIPQPDDRRIYLKDILEGKVDEKYYLKNRLTNFTNPEKSYCLDASYHKGASVEHYLKKGKRQLVSELNYLGSVGDKDIAGDGKKLSRNVPQGNRVHGITGKSPTLSANGGGLGAKTGLYAVAPNGKQIILNDTDEMQALKEGRTELGKQSRREVQEKLGRDTTLRTREHKAYFGRNGEKANCITTSLGVEGMIAEGVALRNRGDGKKPEYNSTEKANALTTAQTDSMAYVNYRIRKLTPIECERLQSMPDNWTNPTGIISNTQRYKMCGNAFNVDVVAWIIKRLT